MFKLNEYSVAFRFVDLYKKQPHSIIDRNNKMMDSLYLILEFPSELKLNELLVRNPRTFYMQNSSN